MLSWTLCALKYELRESVLLNLLNSIRQVAKIVVKSANVQKAGRALRVSLTVWLVPGLGMVFGGRF